MARGGPDSATHSFFICIGDQPSLDQGGMRNADGQGFAAFGRVVAGDGRGARDPRGAVRGPAAEAAGGNREGVPEGRAGWGGAGTVNTRAILVGLGLGLGLGIAASATGSPSLLRAAEAAEPLGQVFLRAIQMVVIPLVAAVVFVGVARIGNLRKLGRLGAFRWASSG